VLCLETGDGKPVKGVTGESCWGGDNTVLGVKVIAALKGAKDMPVKTVLIRSISTVERELSVFSTDVINCFGLSTAIGAPADNPVCVGIDVVTA